ncbi:hypothetical protein [Acuticoccus kandeliae]|uniref:hypothetical protein n=1 Tax=Acuticoccus kandeliae TaxID=2073160 RepID=UPI000D3E9E2F|nr:hypothetical protein [Acuticoccus kandeliae]
MTCRHKPQRREDGGEPDRRCATGLKALSAPSVDPAMVEGMLAAARTWFDRRSARRRPAHPRR